MIFGPAAGCSEGVMHALREIRAEERVVLDIDPQHRHPRGAAEIGGRRRPFFLGATIVPVCLDPPPAANGEKVVFFYLPGGVGVHPPRASPPPRAGRAGTRLS